MLLAKIAVFLAFMTIFMVYVTVINYCSVIYINDPKDLVHVLDEVFRNHDKLLYGRVFGSITFCLLFNGGIIYTVIGNQNSQTICVVSDHVS